MADAGYLWVEEGQLTEGPVAEVAPIPAIDHTYTFTVPPGLSDQLRVGHRVLVPLRKSGTLVPGFVVRLDRGRWDSTVRPVHSILDRESFLGPDLVELGRQISGHYCCPLGVTLKAMTPQAVRDRRGVRRVKLILPNIEVLNSTKHSKKRQAVADHLVQLARPQDLNALQSATGASPALIRSMVRAGQLTLTEHEEPADFVDDFNGSHPIEPDYSLNAFQAAALEQILAAIESSIFKVLLLYGVSGSGKTEVYIQAIRKVVASGKQAIFLVPEIVLTTQLAARLAARLPGVAIQHSGMTQSQRAAVWRQIASGQNQVVVGARSAVFAPCPNLGLIVVDEEQETSYKNLQAPRFHVRDVAIMRARQLGIPAVLGSATPSLETWHRAHSRPDYWLLTIPERVLALPMPHVRMVDMRDEMIEQKKPVILSRVLEEHLDQALARGEQALVLVNRRGFAQRVFCPVCKSKLSCPNCSASLVVHAASAQAICHYCRTQMPIPTRCPQVGCGATLLHVGAGTQRIEQVLAHRFPAARILRVDSDTLHRKEQYEKLIADFEARHVDVLVGTQMIAKGLDFPQVSFVAMLNADVEGFSADFRAHERLFQLVTQVAGRAGRAGLRGHVVIQTTAPELPALGFAAQHDYAGFAALELESRRRVGFPPFGRLVRFIVSHKSDAVASAGAAGLADRVRRRIAHQGDESGAMVLGPTPAALARLRSLYRHDVLLRASSATPLRNLLSALRSNRELSAKPAQLVVDVDPVSMT